MLRDFGIERMVLEAKGTAADLHGWGLRPFEQEILTAVVESSGYTEIFEIGTFDGGTTSCPTGGDWSRSTALTNASGYRSASQ